MPCFYVDILCTQKRGIRENLPNVFSDPKNPAQSKEEAFNLIAQADSDGDGFLDWSEVKAFASEAYSSKWVSPEIAFHGDL